MQALAIARQGKQTIDGRCRVVQVIEGLEQRHHAHRSLQAGLLEQQLYGEHIGGRVSHGDDVGTQRRRWRFGDHRTGGEHFGGIGGWVVMRRQQRAPIGQLVL